jgi:uncharacterized protein YpuA (DUF1002 family)
MPKKDASVFKAELDSGTYRKLMELKNAGETNPAFVKRLMDTMIKSLESEASVREAADVEKLYGLLERINKNVLAAQENLKAEIDKVLGEVFWTHNTAFRIRENIIDMLYDIVNGKLQDYKIYQEQAKSRVKERFKNFFEIYKSGSVNFYNHIQKS